MARAGRFRDRITIQKKSATQEAVFGTDVLTWPALVSRLPANVEDMLPSRSEAVQQGLKTARDQVRIRIRYRTDVTSAMRIVLHEETDTIYQIVAGPATLGRREQLEMVCEKFSS